MFEARVRITLKQTVADPQGLTIKHALESLDFTGLCEVRMGKFIILKLDAGDQAEAKARAEAMCAKLLANPIIEDYAVEVSPL